MVKKVVKLGTNLNYIYILTKPNMKFYFTCFTKCLFFYNFLEDVLFKLHKYAQHNNQIRIHAFDF